MGATDAFLKALNINPQVINDTERLTMIYENLAECYQSQGFYDKAMEMYAFLTKQTSTTMKKKIYFFLCKESEKYLCININGIAQPIITMKS